MKIDEYLRPKSIEDAYNLLKLNKEAVIIGGGAFLRLSNRHIKVGIDLSDAKLDYINEKENEIEIGAMTTFRTIEKDELMKQYFDGVIVSAVSKIMGVQMRNLVTVGGSINGKYGFSDFIPALLALDCKVVLYKNGSMPLADYLKYREKDIVEKIVLRKSSDRAVYKDFRNTSTDFPTLNVAVSVIDGSYKIAVGARPGTAVLSYDAAEFLNSSLDKKEAAEKAGEIASETLQFGSDIRATGEYRKELCKVLVKRAILEVTNSYKKVIKFYNAY